MRLGWVFAALLIPIAIMGWGLITVINARLGWTLAAVGFTLLGTSTVLERRDQERLAGKFSLSGEGRQSLLFGLKDAVLTFAGSLAAIALLLVIVVLLHIV